MDQNLGLRGKYSVFFFMQYVWLLSVQVQFWVIRCISDFRQGCISKTAGNKSETD